MVFSNLVFLYVFLPIVLLIYYFAQDKLKNIVLLLVSLVFYAWGEPKYVFLMIFSIVMNYFFGLVVQRFRGKSFAHKTALWISILANLSLLGFYKYGNFAIENINQLFNLHINNDPIPLPIGISFFTFHAMSYIIDVYRKGNEAQKNLWDLALYITFFPQLVAGPIIRYNTIADQLKNRIHNITLFAVGIKQLIIGLSKKVLIANPLGEIADTVFATGPADLSQSTAWIGIMAYTLQLYFDFSGYSDMALGLAKMFGFEFPINFNYPYIANSISEFWRRWHISLSSWFRDYVYIPLGGNRVSEWKIYRNILIVWTITGLWHGASWTFMAWGFYYGVIISMERLFMQNILQKLWTPIRHIYVIVIVMVGWVFFRADNFSYSYGFIKTMFGFGGQIYNNQTILLLHDNTIMLLIAVLFVFPIYPYLKEKLEKSFQTKPMVLISKEVIGNITYIGLLLVVTMYLVNSTYNPFIYFRF
ncbi:MBOAT family O-acyltransferase [Neobacillus sp. NPDC093127]|uniref:MBOAT family O-acyltransferase n=1 Tax=Neobacillus sp. NPDC093127 TaxID=3364296 RepID=UPI0038110473